MLDRSPIFRSSRMFFGKQILVIVGIALVATIASAVFHPRRPAWYRVQSPEQLRWQIDLEKAKSLITNEDPLLVDARTRSKYEAGHLPSAILLNQQEWGNLMFTHMDRLQDAMDETVIVYCDGSDCGKSEGVAQQLRDLIGLEPVYVLKGDWRELNLPGENSSDKEGN